jgi:hypothetical protein
MKEHDLGYFGNLWVRQNVLQKAGDYTSGHYHYFDHVSLLAKGSVEVNIEGFPPKTFVAPTFIVIRKEYAHSFKALEDDTLWYCVFAIRGEDGEVSDIVPPTSDPFFIKDAPGDYWEKRRQLEKMSIEVKEKDQ